MGSHPSGASFFSLACVQLPEQSPPRENHFVYLLPTLTDSRLCGPASDDQNTGHEHGHAVNNLGLGAENSKR